MTKILRTVFFLALIFHVWFSQAQTIGDTLFSFNAGSLTPTPDRYLAGIVFAEDHFWITGFDPDDNYNHKLYKISSDGETLVDYFEYPFGFAAWKGLAYDGSFLYVADVDTIRQLSLADGQETGLQIPGPIYYQSGLTYDPESDHFWVSGDGQLIYEIDRDGTIISSVSFLIDQGATGLAWDTWTAGGPYLWVWSTRVYPDEVRPVAYQINPATGQFTGLIFEGAIMHPGGELFADYSLGATLSDQIIDDKVVFAALHGTSYQQNNDQLDWVVCYDLAPETTGVPGPEILVTPPFIENDLLPGDSANILLTISNLSDSFGLDWYATLEYPGMPDSANLPGTLLDTYSLTALTDEDGFSDLVYLNGHFYALTLTADYELKLFGLNTALDSILSIQSISYSSNSSQTMTSDGSLLYFDETYVIKQYDPILDSVTDVFLKPSSGISSAMAIDPQKEHFYLGYFNGLFREINRDGDLINQYVFPNDISGLAWDEWSPGGPFLWIAHKDETTGNTYASRIEPFTGGSTGPSFLLADSAVNHKGLFVSPDYITNKLVLFSLESDLDTGEDLLKVFDLAATPAPGWIRLQKPAYGFTEALGIDSLLVSLHAIMEDTLMMAQLVINSNDVLNPRTVIPVNFRMLPATITSLDNNLVSDNKVLVYPVPAGQLLNVRIDSQEERLVYQILDISGRVLLQEEINANTPLFQFRTENLPSGIYQILIRGKKYFASDRFLVR